MVSLVALFGSRQFFLLKNESAVAYTFNSGEMQEIIGYSTIANGVKCLLYVCFFVSEVFILIKGNVCMLHGPMGSNMSQFSKSQTTHDKRMAF